MPHPVGEALTVTLSCADMKGIHLGGAQFEMVISSY